MSEAGAAAAPPATDPPPPEAGGGFAKDDKVGASHHILNDSTASWDGDGTLLTEPSTPGSASFPGGGRLEIDFIPSFAGAGAGGDDDGAGAGAWAADFAKFDDFGGDVPGGPPVAAGLEAELGGGAAGAGAWMEWDGLPKEVEAEGAGAELDEEDSWPESVVPAKNQRQGAGSAKEKQSPWACWRTRRGKALVVGAVLVVVVGAVVGGVAVGASSKQPASPSTPATTETSNGASPPNAGAPEPATAKPASAPTAAPSSEPTAEPSAEPTAEPSAEPTAGPTYEPISTAEFLQSLPPSTIERLADESSPQYQAFHWVTEKDEYELRGDEDTRRFRMKQRFALATVLYSVRRSSAINSTGTECSWDPDVECNSYDSVVSLQPDGNGGTIPREVGLLTRLTYLSFKSDSLTSTIPTELGQLTALSRLSFYNNSLTGRIPTELGNLRKLTLLSFSSNMIRGTIPTELGQLTYLSELYMSNTLLTGTFPSAMCEITYSEKPNVDLDEVSCTCCV